MYTWGWFMLLDGRNQYNIVIILQLKIHYKKENYILVKNKNCGKTHETFYDNPTTHQILPFNTV